MSVKIKPRNNQLIFFIVVLFWGLCVSEQIIAKDNDLALDHIEDEKNRQVTVAVIDTGIDISHDFFKERIWMNENEIANDGIDNDKNGYIDDIYGWNFYSNQSMIYNSKNNYDDHGTHCAGIIVENTDHSIRILSIKVLGGKNRTGTVKNLIKAIEYAEQQGADICNISLGTSYSDTKLEQVMRESNMLFVVAAGNNKSGINVDKNPIYPASYKYTNIISVANIDEENMLHATSNYGKKSVSLAAYGNNIYSSITHNKYDYMSGTSMATALVTAVIANIYTRYPFISLEDAKEAVLNTVTIDKNLYNKVKTSGYLNMNEALSYYE